MKVKSSNPALEKNALVQCKGLCGENGLRNNLMKLTGYNVLILFGFMLAVLMVLCNGLLLLVRVELTKEMFRTADKLISDKV